MNSAKHQKAEGKLTMKASMKRYLATILGSIVVGVIGAGVVRLATYVVPKPVTGNVWVDVFVDNSDLIFGLLLGSSVFILQTSIIAAKSKEHLKPSAAEQQYGN